jgi:hypothetical protein
VLESASVLGKGTSSGAEDRITGLEADDARANGLHDTCQINSRTSELETPIERIYGSGVNLEENFIRFRDWLLDLADLKDLARARSVEDGGFHINGEGLPCYMHSQLLGVTLITEGGLSRGLRKLAL